MLPGTLFRHITVMSLTASVGMIGGAPGVLTGQAPGGVVFGVLSVWLVLRVMSRAGAGIPAEPFDRQIRLLQVLRGRR